jgi:2Fe-2S ferredoxin
MPKITYVLNDGSNRAVDLPVGTSLMEGAINNAIPGVLGDCGGGCACATCHLYVHAEANGPLQPVSEMEDDLLHGAAAERRPTSRLGCQVRVTSDFEGLTVTVPERQT